MRNHRSLALHLWGSLLLGWCFVSPSLGQGTNHEPDRSASSSPRPSLAAKEFCERFSNVTSRTECEDIIKTDRIDDNALVYCAAEKSDPEKFGCLQTIKGVVYDRRASHVCLAMRNREEEKRCFGVIGNKHFAQSNLEKCGSQDSEP